MKFHLDVSTQHIHFLQQQQKLASKDASCDANLYHSVCRNTEAGVVHFIPSNNVSGYFLCVRKHGLSVRHVLYGMQYSSIRRHDKMR